MSTNPPKETIYVNNLPDKLQKDELKRSLYYLFSQYGPIIDVVAMKTPSSRGQAFIIFRHISHATSALRASNGLTFFGKPMQIQYAKVRSECIDKIEGTFRQKNAKLRRREREEKEREHIKKLAGRETPQIESRPKRDREAAQITEDNRGAKKQRVELGEPNKTLILTDFPVAVLKQAGALKVLGVKGGCVNFWCG